MSLLRSEVFVDAPAEGCAAEDCPVGCVCIYQGGLAAGNASIISAAGPLNLNVGTAKTQLSLETLTDTLTHHTVARYCDLDHPDTMSSNASLNVRVVADNEASHAEMPETHKVSKNDRLWRHNILGKSRGKSDKNYAQLDSDADSAFSKDPKEKKEHWLGKYFEVDPDGAKINGKTIR
ncbi:hypothetical protein AB5N19_08521 [Seiridium cardinale]|uniref:Uncharacterized protein n=1 Tax=Seiridium cardinale TaxID=138064 RepID=A0ABR2XUZ7_9PEZI